MHVGSAAELVLGQADIEIAAKTKMLAHCLADDVAEIPTGDGLDQHAQCPVCAETVVMDFRARRPLERKVADHLAQPLVVGPGIGADDGVGKPRLMGDCLQDCDVALGVRGELRHVVGDPV